jgi:hypothetical protein
MTRGLRTPLCILSSLVTMGHGCMIGGGVMGENGMMRGAWMSG